MIKSKTRTQAGTTSTIPIQAPISSKGTLKVTTQSKGPVVPQKYLGHHVLVEFYGCPIEILEDIQRISMVLKEAAKRAKVNLLDLKAHKFEPQGLSAIALLEESHISIHTWPECNGAALCDIFTCGTEGDPFGALEYLGQELKATHKNISEHYRGVLLHSSLMPKM